MPDNGPYIELRGSLQTDGEIVYIGGMDLANILRASVPGWSNAGHHGKTDHGQAVITIERVGDAR